MGEKLGLVDKKPEDPLPWVYLYTEKAGWIDLGHFLTTARAAGRYGNMESIILLGAAFYEEYTKAVGSQHPELPGMGSSANTFEDPISNRLGAQFGSGLKKDVPLSKQLKEFFEDLGAAPPQSAWNVMFLPRNEDEWETCWRNFPDTAMKRQRIVLDRSHQFWTACPPDSVEVFLSAAANGIWGPLLTRGAREWYSMGGKIMLDRLGCISGKAPPVILATCRVAVLLWVTCAPSFGSLSFGQVDDKNRMKAPLHNGDVRLVVAQKDLAEEANGKESEISQDDSLLCPYRSFGATQIYATQTELWLFLDIDEHTERAGSASPPRHSSWKEFHVYVLDGNGLHSKWRSSDPPLTAHQNFTKFFRYGRDTFAYAIGTRTFYRWQADLCGTMQFVPVSTPSVILGPQAPKTSEIVSRLLDASHAAGFSQVDAGYYGYGKSPPADCVVSKVGVRLRFERVRNGGVGWCRVTAESLSSPHQWREVLLQLDPCK